MSKTRAGSILHYLHQSIGPEMTPAVDEQLLRRFVHYRDEAAFAALVRRHGPLVWDVCRRLLRQDEDAEDAFQATFLILANRAASIRKRGSLASWLYGVATRTAWNARKSVLRRLQRERRPEERPGESPVAAAALRELQTMLDEEVQRLPEKYRAPFLLCCLEGKDRLEAARELGWKEGTVSSRLAQARERLRKRLTRRGVALSAVLCAGAISGDAVSAAGPVARAAARDVSERAISWAKGVLRSMVVTKLKTGVALVLMLGCLAAGGTAAVRQAGADKQPSAPAQPAPKAAEDQRADADSHSDPLPPGALARLGTTRFRGGCGIGELAISPDGRILASSGSDDVIRIWDAVSGKEIRQIPIGRPGPLPLAFHPDGKRLAVGMNLHDVATGEQLGRMMPPRRDPAGGVNSVAFSPDGKLLASGHEDKTARLWDVATGKQLRKLDVCRNNRVTCVAFSPDGKTLATGGQFEEHALRLWDVATGRERFGVRGNVVGMSGGVEGIAFAPDGKTVATAGGFDNDVRLWDAASGRELRQFHGHTAPPRRLAFSPDGKQLVSGGTSAAPGIEFNRAVRVWDVASGEERYQLAGHQDSVLCIAFAPDGRSIATGGGDGCIARWDSRTGKPLRVDTAPRGAVQSIAIAPDGKTIATRGGETILWDSAKAKELHRLPGGARGIAFAPDGKLLAITEADGSIGLWSAESGREQRRLRGHKGAVKAVAFSPDGKLLASGGTDGTTRLWDVAGGRQIRQMIGQTPGQPPKPLPGGTMPPTAQVIGPASVDCLAFAPDGATLSSGHSDNAVRLWETATGKQGRQLAAQGPVAAVAFSPDGRILASAGGWDNKVRLWETASGKLRLEIAGHDHRVLALAFSPDGRILASSAWEAARETYLWDARTGKLWGRLGGHRGPILSLAWGRDGVLASGSTDTTVLLWDLRERTPERSRKLLALSPRELEDLWRDLNQRYARAPEPTFVPAVWRLATVPEQSIPFLTRRLRPKVLDEKKIPQWIADLERKERATVEQAIDNLIELGEAAKPALRQAAKGKHTPQGRELIEGLLEGVHRASSQEEARQLEAIEVLRLIDSEESRALLKELAGGTAGAQLTRAAAAALKGEPRRSIGHAQP